ncbi:DUF2071 domain-containing protein [Flavisolibacter ginsengisoli]|uniref:DUF2071 domain-containing protein n=1 Tax=Flavisolibacter ginsengisoli TaxID=462367 RepID=UPI001FEAAF8B|nr:DUF2071 domain-containing protein [Flavisolibacter ginsengisoli]
MRNHPFAVEAFFERSLVFTFAVPKKYIQNLIPACLELDTFNDQFAFIAVAMVQTKNLKPKGFPSIFGNDFFLIGYRVFVRYVNTAGKRLRGLYILKSETDRKKMEFLGNIFTHYKYTTTDIQQIRQKGTLKISSVKSGFMVEIDTNDTEKIALPYGSPFQNWKEARRFAGPLPFTFTYSPESGKVLIIEGIRKSWIPRPVHVNQYNFSFLDNMNLNDIKLANAFVIEKIPYYWKKGKLETWRAA